MIHVFRVKKVSVMWCDVIVSQEILTNSGNMWSGIVLLQNQITLLHKRDCNRMQDLIPIPYRLDLIPIEHMWNELDRRVWKRRNPPATLAQLRNALIDEWNNIPMRIVNALVNSNSIQRRIRAATAARGGAHPILIFSLILISRFGG